MFLFDPAAYRPRIIDRQVKTYLHAFGAVCIEGPKWCGKTWTSEAHCKSQIFIADPAGNFQNRKLAELDPSLVLEGEYPRLIDEWQVVPQIWDAVRFKVDQKNEKGQFILTGSDTPNRKGVLHSGAGRIATLRMRPMSLFESGDSTGQVSLESLLNGTIKPTNTGEVSLKKLIRLIVRGGWPASLGLDDDQIALLPGEYLKAILDDDLNRVDPVKRDRAKIKMLMKSLARNESTTVTNSTLKNDIKASDQGNIDVDTIADYLGVLSRLFLLDNQAPFFEKIRSSVRIRQSEKRHFSDPSLACAILEATPEMLLNDLETLGFMFEALCERDLRIYAESFGAHLYHYQDYRQNEIDAVIQLKDGRWGAFEIKLGANQIDAAAANLNKTAHDISEDMSGQPPSVMAVICGKSIAAYQRPDGVMVVPITALKP